MAKVSVIVPIYGVEKYIERCARSLFEQTLDDIEYIFINDCTKDSSVEILRRVLEDYPIRKNQTRIIDMPTNSGLPTVRKHGIQLATGDFLIHCDSDDWVDKEAYEIMYNKAIVDNADLVISNFYVSDGINHKIYHNKMDESLSNIYFELINVWTHLVKRSLYDNIIYPISNMFEDRLFCIQLSYYSQNISFINKPLYYYYSNPTSICRVFTEEKCYSRYIQAKDNVDKIIAFLEAKDLLDTFKIEIIRLKFIARHQLAPITNIDKYYKIWKECYPEINKTFFFLKKIKFSERIRFILVYFRLFHFFRGIE